MGGERSLLDTGGSGYFSHDSTKLVECAEYNITLRYVGDATYPIAGTGSLAIHLRFGGKRVGTVRLLEVVVYFWACLLPVIRADYT